jgi:uncharacterized protein YjbJ (UPF0337 family)
MKSEAEGFWKEKKGKLLKRFKTLTDKDLRYDEGKEEEMIKILAYKLGKTKQELLNIIITL